MSKDINDARLAFALAEQYERMAEHEETLIKVINNNSKVAGHDFKWLSIGLTERVRGINGD